MTENPRVEQLFKTNGVPTHTFVPPSEFNHLKGALRTRGRGVIAEGRSGIGKTTCVHKALDALGLAADCVKLSKSLMAW